MTPTLLGLQSLTWLGSCSWEGATFQPIPIPESWGDRARGFKGDHGLGSRNKEIADRETNSGAHLASVVFHPLQSLGYRLAGEGPRSLALAPSFNPMPLLPWSTAILSMEKRGGPD